MDIETQTLTSPYYPQNYFSDGDSCEWYITAPEGNIISLEFDHFNVSKNANLKQKFPLSTNNSFPRFPYLAFLLCLMEYVIKQKNYKHCMVQCPMMSNGSFLALDVTCL